MSTQQSARIINPNAGVLTGLELYSLLLNAKHKFRRGTDDPNPTSSNVVHIEDNLLEYFELSTLVQFQSEESVQAFLKVANRFKLTQDECLKIINSTPTTVVDLYLVRYPIVVKLILTSSVLVDRRCRTEAGHSESRATRG